MLRLHRDLAPIKVAFLPLSKAGSDRPHEKAQKTVQSRLMTMYDDTGIGRRYRRQDEIGTPYCVTVDFQTWKITPLPLGTEIQCPRSGSDR